VYLQQLQLQSNMKHSPGFDLTWCWHRIWSTPLFNVLVWNCFTDESITRNCKCLKTFVAATLHYNTSYPAPTQSQTTAIW